ncbi:MAG: hypothetical protein ACOXZU_07165 [Bacteroidales bacterium]
MIKDDPDGTVREEQNEAEINASGTDDTIKNETSEAAGLLRGWKTVGTKTKRR